MSCIRKEGEKYGLWGLLVRTLDDLKCIPLFSDNLQFLFSPFWREYYSCLKFEGILDFQYVFKVVTHAAWNQRHGNWLSLYLHILYINVENFIITVVDIRHRKWRGWPGRWWWQLDMLPKPFTPSPRAINSGLHSSIMLQTMTTLSMESVKPIKLPKVNDCCHRSYSASSACMCAAEDGGYWMWPSWWSVPAARLQATAQQGAAF